MQLTRRTILVGISGALSSKPAFAIFGKHGGGGAGSSPPPPRPLPGALALVRTFNNSSASATPATAFWTIGHPFKKGEVPSGSIVTAKLGGTTVPIQGISSKLETDGSLSWAQLLVNISGVTIAGGGSKDLVLTAVAGSWSSTTTRTNADWSRLVDTVEITSLATTGTSAPDMDGAGTWVAAFDGGGTNTIEVYGQGPLGLWVRVTVPFKNGATTHRFLRASFEYWVTQKADTSLGPVASRGPFITNNLAFKTGPARFDYTLIWKRNGSAQRTAPGVQHYFFSSAPMCRLDGQWDWTANDPSPLAGGGLWVSQDYTQTRKTLKIPPFKDGISGNYTGARYSTYGSEPVTAINTTTGVFTVVKIGALVNDNGQPYPAVAVDFTATSMPGGLSAGTVYWLYSTPTPTTFKIYDTQAHALAHGATGQIIPSTKGRGVVVRDAIAPMSFGQYEPRMGNGGVRADISLLTEWGSAYHCANTEVIQHHGRVMAYCYSALGYQVTDDVTGLMPSLMDASNTPAAMGTARPNTYWNTNAPSYSSDINGGDAPSGGFGQFGGFQQAHTPSSPYAVWLMEGGTFLRDLILYAGNNALGWASYLADRNVLVGSTQFYGCSFFTQTGSVIRAGAWSLRDAVFAWFVSETGSAYKTYFENIMTENAAMLAANKIFEGPTFSALGVPGNFNERPAAPYSPITIDGNVANFMMSFMTQVTAFAALLGGDVVSGLNDVSDFSSQWYHGIYSTGLCHYYVTLYYAQTIISPIGTPAGSLIFVAPSDVGFAQGSSADPTFDYATDGTVTWHASFSPNLPLGVGPAGWLLSAGDKFRPMGYLLNGGTTAPATPSPFVEGTIYFLRDVVNTSPTTGTFKLSATNGGAAITGATPTTGCGGCVNPAGQTGGLCPSSGSYLNGGDEPYIQMQMAGIAMEAIRGVPGAAADFATAAAQYGPYDGWSVCHVAMQSTV